MADPTEETELQDAKDDPLGQPGARDYTLVCVAALLVQVVVLVQEMDIGLWVVLPLLIGCAGLVARWGVGPPLVLLCITAFYLLRYRYRIPWGSDLALDPLGDGALAVATLVYIAGAYRLLSITRRAFPQEARRGRLPAGSPPRWLPPDASTQRSAEQVRTTEVAALLLMGVLFVALACLAWFSVTEAFRYPLLQVDRTTWQTLLVIWLTFLALVVSSSVLGYLGWQQMSRTEAILYLQDQLWRQTRAEQASVQGWLVWAKLRAERRKGR
jgi:hypothetical protein